MQGKCGDGGTPLMGLGKGQENTESGIKDP